MKRLRILQLTSTATIGGTEINLINYEEQLQKFGHYAITCTLAGEGTFSAIFKYKALPFVSLKLINPIRIWRVFKFIRFILQNKFDVVHVYGLKAQVFGTILCKILGVPVIFAALESTDDWRKFYHSAIEKPTYPFINKWIAVSKKVKEAFSKREKIPPQKIIILHNSINTQKFNPSILINRKTLREKNHIADDIFVLGNVANLRVPIKGHREFLLALKKLKEKTSKFHVFFVGEDQSNGKVQALVKELNLENEVTFTGYLEDVREILPVFDAFIIPSLWEGLPLVLLEAMAVGLAVISTSVGGIPEVITNYHNGILIPPENPNVLCDKIIELMENRDLRIKLGQSGIDTIRRRFDVEVRVKNMVKFYSSFLRHRNK